MLKHTFVEFKRGKLLTKEMLESLSERFEIQLQYYSSFCDGILYGMDFEESVEGIVLKKGAVKSNGVVYFLTEDVNLTRIIENSGCEENTPYLLVIRQKDVLQEYESVVSKCLDFEVIRGAVSDKDIFIGSFNYTSGFKNSILNYEGSRENLYKLADIIRFNILDLKYSMGNETTFHPIIFDLIRNVIEEKKPKTDFDFTVLSMLYQNRVVSKNVLRLYIEMAKIDYDKSSNKDLIEKFVMAVDKLTINETKLDLKEEINKSNEKPKRCV